MRSAIRWFKCKLKPPKNDDKRQEGGRPSKQNKSEVETTKCDEKSSKKNEKKNEFKEFKGGQKTKNSRSSRREVPSQEEIEQERLMEETITETFDDGDDGKVTMVVPLMDSDFMSDMDENSDSEVEEQQELDNKKKKKRSRSLCQSPIQMPEKGENRKRSQSAKEPGECDSKVDTIENVSQNAEHFSEDEDDEQIKFFKKISQKERVEDHRRQR